MKEVTAYEYVHFKWSCPHCGYDNREEWVSEEEEVECESCEEVSKVSYIEIT